MYLFFVLILNKSHLKHMRKKESLDQAHAAYNCLVNDSLCGRIVLNEIINSTDDFISS